MLISFEIRLNNIPTCRAFSFQYSTVLLHELRKLFRPSGLSQSTYIPRLPQCMSTRRNWYSPTPSPASECALHPKPKGGGHTRLWGSPNSEDWRKSLALCPVSYILTNPSPTLQKTGNEVILLSAVQGAQQCTFLTS
jgi:hypothetical protein